MKLNNGEELLGKVYQLLSVYQAPKLGSSGSMRNKRFNILGKWVNGGREGHGSILSPRLEKLGVKGIHGWYQEGILTGRGKLIMNDESVREGWFQHGYFHGPAR